VFTVSHIFSFLSFPRRRRSDFVSLWSLLRLWVASAVVLLDCSAFGGGAKNRWPFQSASSPR
jgi:hypothetical protein